LLQGLCVTQPPAGKAAAVYAVAGPSLALIEVPWDTCNPSPGVFAWDALRTALAAVPAGSGLVIGPLGGFRTPAWVTTLGNVSLRIAPGYHLPPGLTEFPVVWAAPYTQAYLAFSQALAAELHSLGYWNRVVGVKFSLYSALDFELQIPWVNENNGPDWINAQVWSTAGYRPVVAWSAWLTTLDAFSVLWAGVAVSQPAWKPNAMFPWVAPDGTVQTSNSEAVAAMYYASAATRYSQPLQIVDTSLDPSAPVKGFFPDAVQAGCVLGFQTNTGLKNQSELLRTAKNAAGLGSRYLEVHWENVLAWPKAIPDVSKAINGV